MGPKIVNIEISNHLTAFDSSVVGSKVEQVEPFFEELEKAIRKTDFSNQQQLGQAYIPLNSAKSYVSCGVGHHSEDPNHYVIRKYRGRPRMFLKRQYAAETDSLAVVVYSRKAYLNDPDVQKDVEELERIKNSNATYVLVAVLASAGEQSSPLSPGRLVHNIAGGNNEAQQWTKEEIVEKAQQTIEYYNKWSTVSD